MLAACDSVFVSVRCGIITPRSRRGDMLLALCPASSRPPASYGHIVWVCGRLLGKTAGGAPVSFVAMWSSFRLCRCLPRSPSSAYFVRFSYVFAFRLGNRVRPAPRVEQDGEQDGEGFCPSCLICPGGDVSACGDGDVDDDECGRRGVLPVLFLARPPLVRSCRSACLNCSPAPRAWEARAVRAICGGGRAGYLLAFSLLGRSLARRSFAIVAVSGFPATVHMTIMSLIVIVFVFLRRAWCGVFSCVSFAASRLERRVCQMWPRLPVPPSSRSLPVSVGVRYCSSRHR